MFGLVAETDLSPLNSRAKYPLGRVVCWFDSLDLQEGEQAFPMFGAALCHVTDIVVGAAEVVLKAFVHTSLDRHALQHKGVPVQTLLFEGMPQGEHSARLGKYPFGEFHGVRASARVLDAFDLADDMSPTELSDTLVKRLVSRIHIRAEGSFVDLAQDILENLGTPRRGNVEKGYILSCETP